MEEIISVNWAKFFTCSFTNIIQYIVLLEEAVSDDDIKTALILVEEKLCLVWAMIKGNVEIDVKYLINNKEEY